MNNPAGDAQLRPRILVVEDNKDLALGLRVNLEEAGYAVTVAVSLVSAMESLRRIRPQLVVLDLGLPDGNGLQFIQRLRSTGDETLILVLTAHAQQDIKLSGLRSGADDYVTKPFDLEEFLVRVEVLLRRLRTPDDPPEADTHATIGDVEVDGGARVLRRNGEILQVSRIGFDLLLALLRRRGTVVTRAELMRDVWGYSADVASRTLDTHVFDLRRLIEQNPAAPVYIRTVWRIGYRLD